MEGYTSWYKYQTRAASLILRWGHEQTEFIWGQLFASLHDNSQQAGEPHDIISIALSPRGERLEAFLDLAAKVGQQHPGHGPLLPARRIGEAQLWALMIAKAEPETTSIDRLADAHDRMQRLTIQDALDLPRHMRNAIRARQTKAGQGKAGKLLRDNAGNSIVEMITQIAINPENKALETKDLWPRLLGALDEEGLRPVERGTESGLLCKYDFNDGLKTMSFRRFANVVSDARKNHGKHGIP